MARKRMVTRTIAYTEADARVYDIEKDEIQLVKYKLTGRLSVEEALKVIEKEHKEVRPLKVDEVVFKEELYGMSEDKFIELAEILPARIKHDIVEDSFGNSIA